MDDDGCKDQEPDDETDAFADILLEPQWSSFLLSSTVQWRCGTRRELEDEVMGKINSRQKGYRMSEAAAFLSLNSLVYRPPLRRTASPTGGTLW